MTLTPDDGWSALEDSAGELKLIPPGNDDYGVGFALDLFPVQGYDPVLPAPTTVDEWIGWYQGNPDVNVTPPTSTKIGDIPATRIDVSVSDTAESTLGCPELTCVNIWGFERWTHFNGIAGDDVYRQYLADVTYSGTSHVFSVTVEGRDEADLAAVSPKVESLLRTVTLPVASA